MRLLLLALLVPGIAAAETFDDLAAKATQVDRLDDLVWAVTGACDDGDEIQQRQCRLVRDQRAKELAATTLLVDGDRAALELAKWNPQRRSLAFAVTACIRCSGIEVDGKIWHLVGDGAPVRVEGGKVRAQVLHDSTRMFDDEAKATAWTGALATARVQYVVRLPPQPKWHVGGKHGLALEVLGFRVVAPCHGEIVAAKPASQPIAADPKACGDKQPSLEPDNAGKPGREKLPDALTGQMIRTAMQPVLDAANACSDRYKISGRAKVAMTISSEGAIVEHALEGELVGTPLATCIETALRKVTFPRTRRPRTKVGFPIVVR